MRYVGIYGDSSRMKCEFVENSMTQSAKECVDAGVIVVAASGNSIKNKLHLIMLTMTIFFIQLQAKELLMEIHLLNLAMQYILQQTDQDFHSKQENIRKQVTHIQLQ